MLSSALISSIASGQVPATTALPYVLSYTGGIRVVVTPPQVVNTNQNYNNSNVGQLLGGGLNSLLPAPGAALTSAIAVLSVRKLHATVRANQFQKNIQQTQQDAVNQQKQAEVNEADLNEELEFNQEQAQAQQQSIQALEQSEKATQEQVEAAQEEIQVEEESITEAAEAIQGLEDGFEILEDIVEAIALFPK